mmetsp:Transcript_24480/g.52106  ORF Transcript_24480/g.52106 Transcript_24480/m.52106 type:complete len:196 (+) Transcript_24480:142-729(+)|eukprot:CAMPEP_0201264932 /NCGR_PEP_ID=MMETSP0853-20130426/9840_1 /ASSEMBLY_ACC=CAM_ASM_000640 /TAXON_ID=183588 /ORGANISM="Pseudo-nitzschia fraudulenta, Strain WWA7" /LENGTH=195 /DNA_ID=CAMNT_0047568993 /DNA_START=81 /DNA_END=668 /DNA_ORIENTATION=+
MARLAPALFLALACAIASNGSFAFAPSTAAAAASRLVGRSGGFVSLSAATGGDDDESPTALLSPRERGVYALLKDLSESNLSFRIVVVGNGAILESTNPLGPTFKLGRSPKSGAGIVTFASEDQSFEFHLVPAQIASVALVEKASPAKEGRTMRLVRFLNEEGGSICSLILADDSEPAAEWYEGMAAKYGPEARF